MSQLSLEDLAAVYEPPKPRTLAKALPLIDPHAARFISLSPFCVMASVGPDGTVDASPRGGEPGFVQVETPTSLLLPDRMGNNRLDSFRNIIGGPGELALIFFIPGVDETLRVNGKGAVTVEPALLARLVEFGKPPRAVLRIEVRESFLHCAKALMRSRLWSEEAQVERSVLPSMGQMIRDQTAMGEAESDAAMRERFKDQL